MAKSNDNGGRRLELIDYPEGEELIDHKGRSKPLYKPTSPRPRKNDWRPDGVSRLAMGLFPGLRLMVTKSVPAGLPYALLGLLSGLGALLTVLNWSSSAATIQQLHIQPRWVLLRAGAVLVLICIYELLRVGASLEERPKGPRTPRIMAAFVLPAFLVIMAGPAFISAEPQLVEAAWFAALVLGFGALPASAACIMDGLVTQTHLSRFRIGAGLTLAVLVAIAAFLPVLGVPLFDGLQGAARAAGFRVLPTLIP